ncbi:phage major capsid protein [Hyphococcus sp.]|uniref:phage major capsid protein n=1 Tax=Hyphococcus sp. TaxID=2038636 RepID=UPI0035C6B99C
MNPAFTNIGKSVQAIARAKMSDGDHSPFDIISQDFNYNAEVSAITRAITKAPVTPVNNDNYGDVTSMGRDRFVSAIVEPSIIGRMNGVARVPMNTRVNAMTTAPAADFVGQGAPMPASAPSGDGFTLVPLKIAGLIAFTEELVNSSDEAAANFIGTQLAGAARRALDIAVFDPANAGTADVKPASITNGLTAVTGTANAKNDIRSLIAGYEGDIETASFIARPETLAYLASEGFDASANDIAGIPAFASRAIPTTGGRHVALVDGAGLAFAANDARVRVSLDTAIAPSDDPENETDMVSMFQDGSVAVAVSLFTNWQQMRSNSVAILSGATW